MFRKILSIMLTFTLMFTALYLTNTATEAKAKVTVKYVFKGENKSERGYAQGKITLTGEKGVYRLYWANDKRALKEYKKIAKLSITKNSVSYNMPKQTAIPVNAKKLLVFKSDKTPSNLSVKNADGVYDIPENKRFNLPGKRYNFMSYSDVHIDSSYATYKYSDEHFKMALDMAVIKNVDFMLGSGDNIQNNKIYRGIYIDEWRRYQKILADSDYCNPIYESIGNHDIWQGMKEGTEAFINATGLEGNNNASSKGYYEVEYKGDHIIVMSLEGGFYPDRVEEFSDKQLKWLEGLLKKYSGDGNNIYIIEHSLFYNYGAGDKTDGNPYYSIPLSNKFQSTRQFKKLLKKYKDVIFLSGHTHIALEEQLNYSTNNGTSAQMIHNSSVGGVRNIVKGKLDRNIKLSETEAYIVDVYDDVIIFKGANLYQGKYDPNWCYVVKSSSKIYSELYGERKDKKSGYPQITTGDVDGNGVLNIKDATYLQNCISESIDLTLEQKKSADVNSDDAVNILDVTLLQKCSVGLIRTSDDNIQITNETLASTLKQVKSNLKLYYRYSSYNNYQALKKQYLKVKALYDNNNVSDEENQIIKLLRLQNRLMSVVNKKNVDCNKSKYTIYFENINNWENVYVNCMGKKTSRLLKCSFAGYNNAGNKVYKVKINPAKYSRIVFTNGKKKKTEEIFITDHNICYSLASTSSHYTVRFKAINPEIYIK